MSNDTLADGIRNLRSKLALQGRHDESDEQLLDAFTSRRDDSAFAALVYRHGPMVLHVCRRVLGHHQDAEDAFQATFLVLARNAGALRNKTTLASFLHGTAYRTALKAKQSAARRRKHEGSLGAVTQPRSPTDPADELSWREVRTLLDDEIARLPEIYRSVFVLCCLENVSREEAARRLGLKEGTVSSRMAEARKRLGQRLARRGVELTAVLAATAVATPPLSAMPAGLMATTIKSALAMVTGEKWAGIVSASVAELVKGMTAAMMASKAKIATVALLAASLLTVATSGSLVRWYGRASGPLAATPQLPAAKTENKPKTTTPKLESANTIEIRGRVLGPQGKPIKGARLYSAHNPQELRRADADAVAALAQTEPTDETGRFHVRIEKPDSVKCAYLIAHAAGFGVGWIELKEGDQPSEVTLRLVKDVPIAGRVVNTEGRPVAGVSVSISSVWVPAHEKLDDYLNGWLRNPSTHALYETKKSLDARLDALCGKATTDNEGRFSLNGAGGERIISIDLTGGGVAHRTLFVITRPGLDAKPYNAALQSNKTDRSLVREGFLGLYPPQLTFVADAGKLIEGVVKDADTGKPLAGCKVVTWNRYDPFITAVTNAEGKYRLEGLAKRGVVYRVGVIPPKRSLYLHREAIQQAADAVRFTPIRLDFELVKGALVTGRVADKQTGKGVRCDIDVTPLLGNKFFTSKLPSANRGDVTSRMIEAGEDGRFRLVAIPGPSLLTVQVRETVRSHGVDLWVYRMAVPDPDHKEKFIEFGRTWRVQTADNRFEYLVKYHTVKVIDVKENGETRLELSVDPGATAQIVVQDADGKPLPGALAAGLAEWRHTRKLPEATATVYALNPDKPRQMAFFHAEKKLGGTATVRGDEKGPIIVKLAPLGKVSGRLLDTDGKPLQGVEVSIEAYGDIGQALHNNIGAPSVHTDKEGRFHIEGVVPNLKFWVRLQKDRLIDSEPDLDDKQVKPGETIDFGDVRVKPPE